MKSWIFFLFFLAFLNSPSVWGREILFVADSSATHLYSPSSLYAANYYAKDSFDIRPTELSDFYKESDLPRDFVFYIHGYGKILSDVIERAQHMQELYDVQVVFLYWESNMMDKSFVTLNRARKNMEKQYDLFISFLSLKNALSMRYPDQQYVLFTHSLGAYFIELLGKKDQDESTTPTFNSLVLNSPAVKTRKHTEWFAKLDTNNIVVIYNKKDVLLKGLKMFTSLKAPLGLRANKEPSDNAQYIDMTDIIGYRKPVYETHSYFTGEILEELPEVYYMYHLLLHAKVAHKVAKNNSVETIDKPHIDAEIK